MAKLKITREKIKDNNVQMKEFLGFLRREKVLADYLYYSFYKPFKKREMSVFFDEEVCWACITASFSWLKTRQGF